jgi:hypothetical protein
VLSSTGIGDPVNEDLAIGDVVAMCCKAHSALPGSTQPAILPRQFNPPNRPAVAPMQLLQAQDVGYDVAEIIVGNDDVGHGAV